MNGAEQERPTGNRTRPERRDQGRGGQTGVMPMRQDCKNYESRTYAGGETVRKCNLDLAPEAPWRCPEQCPAYQRRLADVNWAQGTLVTPPTPDEPPGLDEGDDRVAMVLDEAEDHLNEVGARIVAEVSAEQGRNQQGWRRFMPRRRK
jgi:hypothetical protein